MAVTIKRTKTETVSLRLDPKTKFMMDFMSRVQGRSITAIVEHAIREAAANAGVEGDFGATLTWADFWDPSEGIRTLNLLVNEKYPTNFEEDELRAFTKAHWQFFYTDSRAATPRRAYTEILWPNVEEYFDLWKTTRLTNYWAAGHEMTAALLRAQLAPPDWPGSKPAALKAAKKKEEFDLDDEIPF